MRKEYDGAMTFDEAVARIRETMGLYSMNPFKSLDKEWVYSEYPNGEFIIERKLRSRISGHVTLKISPAGEGTHMVLERWSAWKVLCFLAFIWLDFSPLVIYLSGSVGGGIFGVVAMISIHLFFALFDRWEETDFVDYFERNLFVIKRT